MSSPRQIVLVAGVSLAATAVIALVPGLHFAYRNPDLHVALLTAEALIAMLAAFLVAGRYRRVRQLSDLVLTLALSLMALSNLLFAAVPAVFGSDTSRFSTWSALSGRLLGAILFAVAALVPVVRVRAWRRRALAGAVAVAVVLAAIALIVAALGDSLPRGVVEADAEASGRIRLEGHWAVIGGQVVGLIAYVIAAAGFAARAQRTGDRLLEWLAVGSVLAAAGRLNYSLYPSTFTELVYTGDMFRLAFYLVVLAGAVGEIQSYWSTMAANAALEERRRIARELHDSVAQELHSIHRNLYWLDREDEVVDRLRASTRRGLAASRRAISALSQGPDRPLAEALADAARTVAERERAQVVLDLAGDVDLGPAAGEALVQIVSEAVANAARHARGATIRVELRSGDRVMLRVSDDGPGFAAASDGPPTMGGFGLVAMRERAESVGAHLQVSSHPGAGTSVEVVL